MDTYQWLKRCVPLIVFAAGWFMTPSAYADIYRWNDASGIAHFTNERPPAGVKILEHTREAPYDAEADRRRLAEERDLRLQHRWLDVQELWAQTGCTPY